MKLQRNVSAVMAALVLTGMTCSAFATEINATSDKAEKLLGLTMGAPVQTQPEVKHIEDTLTVNVHGKSLTDTGKTKNVSGIYNGFGSQLTVDKDLIVRLKNIKRPPKSNLGGLVYFTHLVNSYILYYSGLMMKDNALKYLFCSPLV